MFGKHLLTALLSLALSGVLAAQQIPQARVEKIITTLAADDMSGRRAGSEGARKAASFIAAQFREAGLQPFGGGDEFLQKFEMFEVLPVTHTLSLDGTTVPYDDFVIRSQREHIDITDLTQLEVLTVGAEDNPMVAIGAMQRNPQAARLVLFAKAHQAAMARFMHYVRKPPTTPSLDKDGLNIIVFTDHLKPSSIHAKAENRVETLSMANVVGVLPGKSKPAEYVLFSGHYDHLGIIEPVGGDRIANGADDDASGTTAVITLAQHFAAAGNNARSLLFVAFTAEEIGGFGSKHLAGKVAPESIAAMVNIEMIGKRTMDMGKGYVTGPEYSNLPQHFMEHAPEKLIADPNKGARLFFRSDNAVFARLGVPAHSISSSLINQDPYYHTVDDEIGTLDLAHMTALINTIAGVSTPLVMDLFTPERIDVGALPQGRL